MSNRYGSIEKISGHHIGSTTVITDLRIAKEFRSNKWVLLCGKTCRIIDWSNDGTTMTISRKWYWKILYKIHWALRRFVSPPQVLICKSGLSIDV